jgi:hypothetical protein
MPRTPKPIGTISKHHIILMLALADHWLHDVEMVDSWSFGENGAAEMRSLRCLTCDVTIADNGRD